MYVRTYVRYVRTYVCMLLYVIVCMYVIVCYCMYVCMYVCTYVRYACMHGGACKYDMRSCEHMKIRRLLVIDETRERHNDVTEV